MLDRQVQEYLAPFLGLAARWLYKYGLRADHLTWLGLSCAAVAGLLLIYKLYIWALIFILLNRLCDGLDGPLARIAQSGGTRMGAFLDIVFDFVAYAGLPFCMAAGLDDKSAWAATAFLLLGIVFSAAAFLAYGIIAGKDKPTRKGFFYVDGLMEGTETVIFLILICLFPPAYAILATIFGLLCVVTAMGRIGRALADYA